MSVITGLFAANKASNAAKEGATIQATAAQRAADDYGVAVGNANTVLDAGYNAAAPLYSEAAGRASAGVNEAANTAVTRTGNAVNAGQMAVSNTASQASGYFDPYSQAGQQALVNLNQLYDPSNKFSPSDLEMDPGYQFRISEGMKALQRSAAARGGALGGAAQKALARYSQSEASQEYQNAFNRFQSDRNARTAVLSNLTGMGYSAAGQQAGIATGAAQYNAGLGVTGAAQQNNYTMGAAEYGGNADQNAAAQIARARLGLADAQGQNLVGAGSVRANSSLAQGQARAGGIINSANAWSNYLNQVGSSIDSAAMMGMGGGGGGFNMGALMSGRNPIAPQPGMSYQNSGPYGPGYYRG